MSPFVSAETSASTSNRKASPDSMPWFFRLLMPFGRLFDRAEPVAPDIPLEDGQSLAEYGIEASVLHLPGHSQGSIGVLTGEGDLICGDLFWNTRKPRLHPLIDDLEQIRASVARLRDLPISMVHPAHGKPFKLSDLPKEMS